MDAVARYKKEAQKQNDKEPGKSIGYWLLANSIKYSGQSKIMFLIYHKKSTKYTAVH